MYIFIRIRDMDFNNKAATENTSCEDEILPQKIHSYTDHVTTEEMRQMKTQHMGNTNTSCVQWKDLNYDGIYDGIDMLSDLTTWQKTFSK